MVTAVDRAEPQAAEDKTGAHERGRGRCHSRGSRRDRRLAWFFVGARRSLLARPRDGVQEVRVTSGRIRPGRDLGPPACPGAAAVRPAGERRLHLACGLSPLRREPGAIRLRASCVERRPGPAGRFSFASGMNVIHGSLVIEPAPRARRREAQGGGPGERDDGEQRRDRNCGHAQARAAAPSRGGRSSRPPPCLVPGLIRVESRELDGTAIAVVGEGTEVLVRAGQRVVRLRAIP